jgi:hypothetical protein
MIAKVLVLLPFLAASATQAALIVNLNPADARFDSLTDNDDPAGGFAAGAPTAANGLTFNVTFTPAAGDVDSSAQAVNIVEIGGDANGSGLYLLGGELHFLSKMNGLGSDFVVSFDDLDFSSGNNLIGVKSSFGILSAGTEYTVAVLFDPIDAAPSLEIGVLPTGGSLTKDVYSVTGVGVKTNWHGDNSASAFRGTNVGNLGGTVISTNANTTNPFHENNINGNPFEGTQGQALYWDLPDAEIVAIPEPAGSTLLLLGASVAFMRRRR